ncbi:phage baseplate assembly protein V [Erwinia rhapontici]|uniref:phage baseplate assembly protein V n=1 Tax=Erwinia rhapontici TaxID=55212 RepID=UPI00105B2509|nr:phage baseplate assembly protein V [Erwinia rhapontici]NKG32826.1 phage baseplate assembly protein V [Erwinia rhapontici]TDS93412.1 phage baseplate assembly protein V [Erwinia rhapontici]UDQ80150.1 phage baseplate assembly protein V [Erwinia rhapontici]
MTQAESARLLQNLIRVGIVIQVDYLEYVARVQVGGNTTDWIRWGAQRAGDAQTWWAPAVGEQVVILSPGGDLENAFIAFSLYGADALPPDTSQTSHVTRYPDGAKVSYDPASGMRSVTGIKNALVDASGAMTLNLSQLIINADVVINGTVTQGGGNMSSNGVVVHTHVHSGVQSGPSKTGGPQ